MKRKRIGVRSLLLGALLALAGCGGGGGGGGEGRGPFIQLMALSLPGGAPPSFGALQQARVCTDSTCSSPITTATVTVNGTALTYDADQGGYSGAIAIALGAPVTAAVTVDGETYTASARQFTSVPTVTAPTSGATWDTASAHTISWTGGAPTSGAAYIVGVMDGSGAFVFPGTDEGPAEIAVSTHSLTVPAGALAAGDHDVMVGIGSAGLVGEDPGAIRFSGAAPGSTMWLAALASFVPVTVSRLPAAPGNVRATAGNGQVGLEWDEVAGATSYNVYWSMSAGVTQATGTKIEGATSPHLQAGLENGVTYHYVVTAMNGEGESDDSLEATATPSTAPFVQVMVLSLSGGGVPPFGFLQQASVCTDFTCGTRIEDATVRVNGTQLTWDAVQQGYSGTATIALGATVTAEVTVGADTFTATGTQLSSAPTVSAPTAGASWNGTVANTISWTGGAPTAGAAYFVGVMGDEGFAFPADGHGPGEIAIGTHSSTVPADALPDGDYQVLVGIGTAGLVDHGSGGIAFSGGAAAGSGLWLGAIAPLVSVSVSTPPPAPFIRAMVLTMHDAGAPFGMLEQVDVCSDSTCATRITDAAVRVNGNALSWDSSRGSYIGTAAIAPGVTVTAQVTVGTETYSATGTQFTAFPSVSAPAPHASWASTSAHTISWSGGAPTAGAVYFVGVLSGTGQLVFPAGGHGPHEIAIGTTSLAVPAHVLPAGDASVMVGIGTPGISDHASGGRPFTGAAAGSAMWLGAIASLVPVTVQ
jgi:hypothetical protein